MIEMKLKHLYIDRKQYVDKGYVVSFETINSGWVYFDFVNIKKITNKSYDLYYKSHIDSRVYTYVKVHFLVTVRMFHKVDDRNILLALGHKV